MIKVAIASVMVFAKEEKSSLVKMMRPYPLERQAGVEFSSCSDRAADEEAFAELERLLADLFLIEFGDPEQPIPPKFLSVAREVTHAMCEAAPPATVQESLRRLKGLCASYDIE